MRPILLLLCALSPLNVLAATGQQPVPAIHHQLSIKQAHSHLVQVASTFPAAGPTLELMMAVWTPGSYLVREFSRQVEQFKAFDQSGRVLPVRKSAKNRWLIDTANSTLVKVRYQVYARELSVRTSFVDAQFALLNGASIFMAPVDGLQLAHSISLDLPEQWTAAISSLPRSKQRFVARNYDILVDNPIVAGSPTIAEFVVAGVKHNLVHIGDTRAWDLRQAVNDVSTLVTRQYLFWGNFPTQQPYTFINLVVEGRGGLEHQHSTVLMTSRYQMRRREDYLKWLSLVSHEYFHRWNVKRLRPAGLAPIDYEAEQYTDGLWVAEGITSYYSKLMLTRSGLMTPAEFFESLAKQIRQLALTPGQRIRSVEQASRDAWIKHYRPDENSINSTVSYYNKGALLGFLLDAWIREASADENSLDDLMRQALQQFGGERGGFTASNIRDLASQAASVDMNPWFDQFVSGTEPLEYNQALEWYGLELDRTANAKDEGSSSALFKDPPRASIGAKVEAFEGRLLVTEAPRGSAAFVGGLNVDDEILAIDQVRVLEDQWELRFAQLRVGQQIELLIARRGTIMSLDLTLELEVEDEWLIGQQDDISEPQLDRLAQWLGPGWFPVKPD